MAAAGSTRRVPGIELVRLASLPTETRSFRVISKIRMGWMIQAEDVRKTYRIGKVDVPALRGVSLQVERGELSTTQ